MTSSIAFIIGLCLLVSGFLGIHISNKSIPLIKRCIFIFLTFAGVSVIWYSLAIRFPVVAEIDVKLLEKTNNTYLVQYDTETRKGCNLITLDSYVITPKLERIETESIILYHAKSSSKQSGIIALPIHEDTEFDHIELEAHYFCPLGLEIVERLGNISTNTPLGPVYGNTKK